MARRRSLHCLVEPPAFPAPSCDRDRLGEFQRALETATRLAIDTEVSVDGPGAGLMRVMSVATRSVEQDERAFVIDARDLDPALPAPLLSDFNRYHGLAWATSHYLGVDSEGKGSIQLSFTTTDDHSATVNTGRPQRRR